VGSTAQATLGMTTFIVWVGRNVARNNFPKDLSDVSLTTQGLLDNNDMLELKRNQKVRHKAFRADLDQILPAELKASSKSGPVVSVGGQDQVRLTKSIFTETLHCVQDTLLNHFLTKVRQLILRNAYAKTTWQRNCLGNFMAS